MPKSAALCCMKRLLTFPEPLPISVRQRLGLDSLACMQYVSTSMDYNSNPDYLVVGREYLSLKDSVKLYPISTILQLCIKLFFVLRCRTKPAHHHTNYLANWLETN